MNPIDRIADHKMSDSITIGSIVVEGAPPWGFIGVSKIWAKITKVIAFRTQVVIDHVHDDRKTGCMTGIDQPLEAIGATIVVLGSKEEGSIVSPVSGPRALRHRQEFNGRDANLVAQIGQTADDGIKGPVLCKGAGMELVDDVLVKGQTTPSCIRPGKCQRIDNFRGAVNAVRL